MKTSKRLYLVILITIIMILTSMNIAQAMPYSPYALNYSYPITYYSSMYFSNETRAGQYNVIWRWNDAIGVGCDLLFISSVEHDNPNNYPTQNWCSAIYSLNRGAAYQAQNTIFYYYYSSTPTSGVIYESDINYNCYFPLSNYGASGCWDVESLFVHEVGHTVGLDHPTDYSENTVMWAVPQGSIRRIPSSTDYYYAYYRYH